MISEKIVETRLIKNVLILESCLFEKKSKGFSQEKRYLLGFRKGFSLIDIEKSIRVYFRVLSIIRKMRDSSLKILFVGCPFFLEKKITNFLKNSHVFVSSKNWCLGTLANKKVLDKEVHFTVVFGKELFFSFMETRNKNIPSAVFLDNEMNHNPTLIDFPMFFNLNSRAVLGLFVYLISQSVSSKKC